MSRVYTTRLFEPFATATALWSGSIPAYTNPRDPNYPYVAGAQAMQLVAGGGPNGENFVQDIGPNNTIFWDGYSSWDATRGRCSVDFRPQPTDPAFGLGGYVTMFQMKSSADTSGIGNLTVAHRKNSVAGTTVTGNFRLTSRNLSFNPTPEMTTFECDGVTWWRYRIEWQCGSNAVQGGIFSVPTCDSDGWVTVTRQVIAPSTGAVETLLNVTGIPLWVNPGTWFASGQPGGPQPVNWNKHAQIVSWGDYTNLHLESWVDVPGPEEAELPAPCAPDYTESTENPTTDTASGSGETYFDYWAVGYDGDASFPLCQTLLVVENWARDATIDFAEGAGPFSTTTYRYRAAGGRLAGDGVPAGLAGRDGDPRLGGTTHA